MANITKILLKVMFTSVRFPVRAATGSLRRDLYGARGAVGQEGNLSKA